MFDNYHLTHINMPAVFIANGLGACLMLVILLSRHRRIRSSSLDGKLFYGMCLSCLFLCIMETVGFMLDGQRFFAARQISILCSVATLCLAGHPFRFLGLLCGLPPVSRPGQDYQNLSVCRNSSYPYLCCCGVQPLFRCVLLGHRR